MTAPAFNLKVEIDSCVRYLVDRRERDEMLSRSFYDESGCANFLNRLESPQRELAAAVDHLTQICAHFAFGRMDPFASVGHRIHSALENAENALAEVTISMHNVRIEHPPKTRELALQKSAVRLAYAMKYSIGARKIRVVAKQIMDGARLDPVTDSAITRWIQEFKAEDKKSRCEIATLDFLEPFHTGK